MVTEEYINKIKNDVNSYKRVKTKLRELTAFMNPNPMEWKNWVDGGTQKSVDFGENIIFVLEPYGFKPYHMSDFCSDFEFVDGRPITKETLTPLIKRSKNGNLMILPFKVKEKFVYTKWARHIPNNIVFHSESYDSDGWLNVTDINNPKIPHGAGDFLVCEIPAGIDTLDYRFVNNARVKNGMVFASLFDMRAFPDLKRDPKCEMFMEKMEQYYRNIMNKAFEAEKTSVNSNVKQYNNSNTLDTKQLNSGEDSDRKYKYFVIGRYMAGQSVLAYRLQNKETGEQVKCSAEQFAFYVGRGQVLNCTGAIYEDKVIYRGVGIEMTKLPVIKTDGTLRNTDEVGHIERGAKTEDILNKVKISGIIVNGRSVAYYIIKTIGGQFKIIDRPKIVIMAESGEIGNARVQNYNGKKLLRSYNDNFNDLPRLTLAEARTIKDINSYMSGLNR